MRALKATLVALLVATLGLAVFAGVAAAGTKKKTAVAYFSGSPKFNKARKVTAKGTLNTAPACKSSRGMRLQLLNSAGIVIAVLDGSTSDASGNWVLSGQLPESLPAGTNSVRVKATKRTAGKFFCRAGVSFPVAVPVT
ncbi:MAG TPA: hypothetical protein VKA88_03640 [Solirubrobacterales bacterium]|nr:hypothetical protein [Solirubrobacterales bacterium]